MNRRKRKIAKQNFKEIRHRIRKLNREQLLNELIVLLHHPDAASVERLADFEIWHLLLLVKWTVFYGSPSNGRDKRSVTRYRVSQLINLVKDLSGNVREFKSDRDLFLFARAMAFLQFWIQKGEDRLPGIARQVFLFSNLSEEHAFQKSFRTTLDISINEFLDLSILLLVVVLQYSRKQFTAESMCSEIKGYDAATITKVLDAVSVALEDAPRWLRELEDSKPTSIKDVHYEYFEETPFMRCPLIKCGKKYLVVSPHLLAASLSTFVYDTLRAEDANRFMTKFGKMFERLVEKSLRSVHTTILTEDDLKRHFMGAANQRFVDFVVVDNECNIFIEAKGVAMNPAGTVTDQAGTVRRDSKSSILRGLKQALDLFRTMPESTEICGVRMGGKDNYLVIITFKEFYVANGKLFRTYIAPEEVDRLLSDPIEGWPIPLSNIFFVSIDDLDLLLSTVSKGSKTFSDLLALAAIRVNEAPDLMPFRKLAMEAGESDAMLPYLQGTLEKHLQILMEKTNQ